MDWFKIKTKHSLYTNFTDAELGSIVKLQALTAHLEREPMDQEIQKIIPKKRLKSIEFLLGLEGISLKFIIKKVLEDVESYSKEKDRWKRNKRKQREKTYSVPEDVPSDVSEMSPNRLDKIRLNKIRSSNASSSKHPSLKDIVSQGSIMGVRKEICEDFYWHYQPIDWIDKEGRSILDNWVGPLKKWDTREKNYVATQEKEREERKPKPFKVELKPEGRD